MTKPVRVIFFGSELFSAPSLEMLIHDERYDVIAVVTKPDSARGRGHRVDSPLVAKIARRGGIPLFQPMKIRDILDQLTALRPDVGALISYGKIVPQSLIDLFPAGIANFHPSLLPVYRGPSPIETTIVNGDRLTGLTLMRLERDMDAGPIYYQEKVELTGDETAEQLRQRFSARGAELFADKLADIVSGRIKPIEQDDNLAIYCHMITKEDGELDPDVMTARECYDRVRAFSQWPKCRINLAGQRVIIAKAKPLDGFAGDSWPDIIKCASDTFLQVIEVVSPKSGKKISASEFLRGLH